MFGKAWRFLKRNKGKLLFVSLVAGGTYMAVNYLKNKFNEYQEMEAAVLCDKARKYHHFDSVQRSCNISVLSMLPNVEVVVKQCFEVDKILEELEKGAEDKVKSWQRLKIVSIARTLSTVYACCILVVLLRVQFNIIAGHIYPQPISFNVTETGEVRSDTWISPVQQRYLDTIQHFVRDGIPQLCQCVQKAVVSQIGTNSLSKKFTISSLCQELCGVLRTVESTITEGDMLNAPITHFMMPQTHPKQSNLSADEQFYEKLTKATSDTIKSEYFHDVLRQCMCKAESRLRDYVTETYSSLQHDNGYTDLHTVEIPMAKLVPVISGLHSRMCKSEHNTFIPQLLIMPQLKEFACRVYEAASYRDSQVK